MENNEFVPDQEVERIFAKPCEFVAGAANISQIPHLGNLPEFAFVGRSNVGKSSMVNTLVNRKTLVRTSSKPGCTKQINFFKLEEKLILVDLPGYGYAKISKEMKKNWNELITRYLKGRKELARIYLLIDSRHGMKDTDKKIAEILDDCGISYQIVLTKADKSSQNQIKKIKNDIALLMKKHPAMHPNILVTSIEQPNTISELRHEIIANIY